MALNWDKISTQSNSNNSQPKKTSLNWDKINIEQATPIAKAQAMPISEQVTNPANILQNATKIQTYNDVAPVETVPTTQAQKNQALIKDLEAKGYKINYATPETKQKALAGEINTQLATKEDYARMANERPNMLEDTGKTIGYNAVAGMANIIDAGYAGGTKLAGLDASTINAENLIRYNKGDTGGFLENTGKTVLDIAGRANPIYGLLRNPMGLGQTVNDSYKKLEQIHKLYPNNTKLNNLYTQITQGTYKGTQEELEKTLSEIQTEIAKGFKAKYTDDDRKRVARQAEINKENYGTAGDIILNKGIGTASQMAPVALASVAFGPAAGTTAIGLQAGGGAYNQALDEGASFDEAFNYGVLSGAAEATIEKISGDAVNKFLLGGKGKTVTGGWVDDFIKSKGINNTFAKVALTTVNDIGGEAVEEGISAAVEPLIAEITYNPDREFNLKEYGASIVTAMIDSIPATLFMGGAGKVQTINAVNKYETGLINEINKSTLTDTQKAELIKGVQEKCADARIGLETNFDEIQAEVAENLQNATQTENVPQNNVENAQNMQESVQSDTKQRLAQILKQAEKEAESNFQPTVKIELINEIKGISKQQASKMDEFPAYQLAKKIYKANAIKKNKNIIVSNRDIKEHINKVIHNNSQRALMKEHLMLLSKLDDIISNGKKVNFSSDEKLRSKYKNWNYYISQTTIDGKPFIAEYELASKEDGVHFRLLRLKKVAHAQTSDQSNTDTAFVSLATSDSLTQTRNYVNNLLPTTEQLQAQDQKQAEEAYNTLNMKKQEDGLKEAIDSISKNENANKVSYTNDFYRNIRTALGEKAGKELTAIFDTQKLSYVKQKQNYANELKTEIVDKLGIKMGSEMSADVQRYGEKLISQAELKIKYPNDWQKIVEADKWFRSKYNKLIDEINATRKEIYPNVEEQIKETKESLLKTYDLIKQAEKTGIAPYKVDQDIQNSIKKLETKIDKKREEIKNFENKNSNYEQNDKYTALIDEVQQLEQNKNELEKTIGIRYEEKVARLKKRAQRLSDTLNSEELWRGKIIPKRDNYYRHFQEMTEGFKALHNIFDTPAEISSQLAGTSEYTKPNTKYLGIAQKRTTNETEYDAVKGFLNYLEPATYAINIDPFTTELRAITKTIKSNTADTKNANKLIEYLDDFANSLAGKTNPFDRSLQKLTNRKTIKTIEWLSNRIKSNAVLGNINSSISQILNLPQVVGKIKDPVKIAQGVFDLATGKGKYQDSQFIQERYHSDIESQFNTKLLQQPKKFATWMLGALDEGVTKTGWNAVYRQAIEKGIENPVQYADDTMRNLVAGRGVGERTLAQESKLVNLIMPFTVETGNYWRVMKDFIDEKDFGGMLITFVVGWLLNKGIEAIGASGKTFDPIDAIYDAITEEDITLLERFGRVGGEILSSMPMGQQIATMYPEYGADLGVVKLPTRESLFGSNDPTRFGTGNMFTNIFQHPITSVAMPWGGTQARRTLEGIEAIIKGGDYKTNSKGEEQLKFPVSLEDMNPAEKFGKITQILTLGKNSTSEAKDYFENGALSAVETQGLEKAQELDMSIKEFYDIMQAIEAIEVPTKKNKEGKDVAVPGARKQLIKDELNSRDLTSAQKKLMYDIFYSKEIK